jgi:hypothetical protein
VGQRQANRRRPRFGVLVRRTTFYLTIVGLGCALRAAPAAEPHAAAAPAPAAAPVEMHVSILLDLKDEREANVVAVIKGREWQEPFSAREILRRLAKQRAAYQVLRSATEETAGPGTGHLSGKLREECAEFFLRLAVPTAARGFAVVSAGGPSEPVRPVTLQSAKIEPAYTAAVAAIVARASKRKISPAIEHAYRIDLDGNGKPEVILQATHPDLNGAPAKYKPQYYSLIVVLPDTPGAEPVFTGYLQADKDMAFFEVLTVDSVADVDFDGKRELLVRARHDEGWQTQVFAYDGKLKELFRSTGGEGECPKSGE